MQESAKKAHRRAQGGCTTTLVVVAAALMMASTPWQVAHALSPCDKDWQHGVSCIDVLAPGPAARLKAKLTPTSTQGITISLAGDTEVSLGQAQEHEGIAILELAGYASAPNIAISVPAPATGEVLVHVFEDVYTEGDQQFVTYHGKFPAPLTDKQFSATGLGKWSIILANWHATEDVVLTAASFAGALWCNTNQEFDSVKPIECRIPGCPDGQYDLTGSGCAAPTMDQEDPLLERADDWDFNPSEAAGFCNDQEKTCAKIFASGHAKKYTFGFFGNVKTFVLTLPIQTGSGRLHAYVTEAVEGGAHHFHGYVKPYGGIATAASSHEFTSVGKGVWTVTVANWGAKERVANMLLLKAALYCAEGALYPPNWDDGVKYPPYICYTPANPNPRPNQCKYYFVPFNPWEAWNVVGHYVTGTDSTVQGRVFAFAMYTQGFASINEDPQEAFAPPDLPRWSVAGPSDHYIQGMFGGGVESGNSISISAVSLIKGNVQSVTNGVWFNGPDVVVEGAVISKKGLTNEEGSPPPLGGESMSDELRLSADLRMLEHYFTDRSRAFSRMGESFVRKEFDQATSELRVTLHGKVNVVNLKDFEGVHHIVLSGHPLGTLVVNVAARGDQTVTYLRVVYKDKQGVNAPTFGRVLLNFMSRGIVKISNINDPPNVLPKDAWHKQAGRKAVGLENADTSDALSVIQLMRGGNKSAILAHIAATTRAAPTRKLVRGGSAADADDDYAHVSFLAPRAGILMEDSRVKGNIASGNLAFTNSEIAVQPFGSRKGLVLPPKPKTPKATPPIKGGAWCLWQTL